ncbi:MAG TPA: ATP-grasp domain-containing protein, partial [Thermoanaerobaculia bacterium]|nr:ATP-grasp domain-containing protein [Thermoanaerobaculia bacterium]
LPAAADPAFSEALLRALEEKRIRLLVPTVTEELPKVAEDRDAIRRRGCAVFIGPAEAVRIANDKWETAHALATRSVDSPRSYCGDSRQELLDLIPLPILSKPRLGRGGRGIEVYESADEVPERLSRERVYQEFLPGEEYDVNLFAGSGGRPRVTVVLRKTALKSGRVGNALAVERVTERDVAKLAERAVQTLALEGPIDVDIRRAASGRPQVLEINARVGANIRSAEEVLGALIDSWENGR